MSEVSPVLQQIHDQFDVFDRYPYTDHSVISNIAIIDRPDGYRVTTYPGGSGYGYDGLAIDVNAPDGMLGGGSPSRVETSRDSGGLMTLSISEDIQERNGRLEVRGTLGALAAREGLTLPGDKGFELFSTLHDQLQGLRAPLQDAIEVAGHDVTPISFDFKESTGSTSYDHDAKKATHHRSTSYTVMSEDAPLRLKLDATTQTELREKPSGIVVYKAGLLEYKGEETALSFDALLAFSGLHSTIRKLYA